MRQGRRLPHLKNNSAAGPFVAGLLSGEVLFKHTERKQIGKRFDAEEERSCGGLEEISEGEAVI